MASAYPLAVQSLLSIFQLAYPLDANGNPVTVWYGKSLGVFQTPVTIEINGFVGDQEPAEIGRAYRREETGSIMCKITSFAGDGADVQAHIDRMVDCWNVWNVLEIAVANNPTLSNTVRFAEFGDMHDSPTTSAQGMAMGCLEFEVRYSQRVTSLS